MGFLPLSESAALVIGGSRGDSDLQSLSETAAMVVGGSGGG